MLTVRRCIGSAIPTLLSVLFLGACGDDPVSNGSTGESGSDTSTSSASADGSGESGETANSAGDGDGDPAGDGDGDGPGDGDGDGPGDGDGDGPGDGDGDGPGDGDGDLTGDGDGDLTGDGDGDLTGDGDGDPVGEDTCHEVNQCYFGCAGDVACEGQCLAQASPDALEESQALLQCLDDFACIDEPCVVDNCGPEAFACRTGDQTCFELTVCLETCEEQDQGCLDACSYASSPLAQAQLSVLEACALEHACANEDCLIESCGEHYAACFDGGSDGLACPLLGNCLIECGNDELCALSCAPPYDEEAQIEAEELAECAFESDCDEFACTEELCNDQWGACVSGVEVCPDILACYYDCSGSFVCESNCFAQGSFPDQIALYELLDCIEFNDCDKDPNCINQNCEFEAMLCGL